MTSKWQQLADVFKQEDTYEQRTQTGKIFTHIRTHALIERLNSVLGPSGWNLDLMSCEVLTGMSVVIVRGCLEIDGSHITQYGSAEYGDTDLTLPDAVKAASSDALARCCYLLGIGAYLRTQNKSEPQPLQKNLRQTSSLNPDPISEKQKKYLLQLAKRQKFDAQTMGHTYSLGQRR